MTIRILPQVQLLAPIAQSPRQATNVAAYRTGTIQAWCPGLGAGETVDLYLEEANQNEESAYVSPTLPTLTLTSSDDVLLVDVTLRTEWVRLRVVPTVASTLFANVRAVLNLQLP